MSDPTENSPQGSHAVRPGAKYSVWLIVAAAMLAGILLWGGFNTAMEATNTTAFCLSCHEMRDNVDAEYRKTVHYANRAGVRAGCPDCHVPENWADKTLRKLQASRELLAKFTGLVDTPEKFEQQRMAMASREWARMKASDSQECRHCHSFEAMRKSASMQPVFDKHMRAQAQGKTCIDCHKGVAHLLPREFEYYGEEG